MTRARRVGNVIVISDIAVDPATRGRNQNGDRLGWDCYYTNQDGSREESSGRTPAELHHEAVEAQVGRLCGNVVLYG